MASLADEFLADFESEEGESSDDDNNYNRYDNRYDNDEPDENTEQTEQYTTMPKDAAPLGFKAKVVQDELEIEDNRVHKKYKESYAPMMLSSTMDDDDDEDDDDGASNALLKKLMQAQANKADDGGAKQEDKKEADESGKQKLISYDFDEDEDKMDKEESEGKFKYDNQFDKDPEYKKMARKLQGNIEAFMGVDKQLLDSKMAEKNAVQAGRSCIINAARRKDAEYQTRKRHKKIQFVLPERQKVVYDNCALTLTNHYNTIVLRVKGAKLKDESYSDQATYKLVIDANALLADIDYEFNKIYNFVRDIYTVRFPELETLLSNKIEYIKAAGLIKNDLVHAKNNLTDKLSDATVMIVAMTASNSQGKRLSGGQLDSVVEACQLYEMLEKHRLMLVKYVQERMSLLAPNVTKLTGPNVAAQLIGAAADGLHGLSRMPGCNILLLGQQKSSSFNAHNKLPHTGFVFYSPLVQSCMPDLRRKAARQVANKIALCARADASLNAAERHKEPELGGHFFELVNNKFEKWEEPPPVKAVKALPKPLEHAGKKRRGGKRYRKMKERLGMTELRKHANRVTFGEIEENINQEDLGISLGHLANNAASGQIRNLVEEKKSKVKMTKKMKKEIAKEQAASGIRTAISTGFRTVHKELGGGKSTVLGWGGTQTSMGSRKRHSGMMSSKGMASSVTFTPVQGLEITNPENRSVIPGEDGTSSNRYFSTTFRAPKLPRISESIISRSVIK